MKKIIITVFSILLIGGLINVITPADEKQPVTIDDIFTLKDIQDVQLSPDGSTIIYVVSSADFNENAYNTDIWKIAYSGGEPIQMTTSIKNDYHPRWSPDGRVIAFLSNRDSKNQIYLMNPNGGEAIKLTNSTTSISDFAWSPCGKKIAYLALEPPTEEEKKREKEQIDPIEVDKHYKMKCLHLIDIKSKEVTQLTKGKLYINSFAWAPQGDRIAFSAWKTPRPIYYYDSDLYVLTLNNGKVQKLVERIGPDTFPHWSPDGKKIAFVSQDGRSEWFINGYLCVIPASGGQPVNISRGFDESIRSTYFWDLDSKSIYFIGPTGVTYDLFQLSVEGGKPKRLTGRNCIFSNLSISKDLSTCAFTIENPSDPEEIYISDFPNISPKKLTTINSDVNKLALGETSLIHWKSKDGSEIEGLLVKPVDYTSGKKYPLLTIVHGGPQGYYINRIYLRTGVYPVHVFANKGYAVFLPNPRGSGNYGEKFRGANYRDWGGGDYQDIMTGVDYLVKEGIADPDKLGVMGWSYGGYMTAWIISQTNRFKAASLGAGMSNLFSFYGQTDIPEFMESYFDYPPWQERHTYLEHSAMYYMGNAKTPTLIQHGEKDIRVPLPQAQELYQALKRQKVPVEFVIYPRAAHGIYEPRMQKEALKKNLTWFNKWIKK
jgi:dipeptidyl aminopeptidase/acylaminoacyl peptidase